MHAYFSLVSQTINHLIYQSINRLKIDDINPNLKDLTKELA